MDDFEFFRPTHYYFGQDSDLLVGKHIKALKKHRVLVIYGSSFAKKIGLIDRVISSIKEQNLTVFSLGGVMPNPRCDLVYEACEICKKEKIDFILAVGGGSVIDTAKACAVGALIENDFFEHFFIQRNSIEKAIDVGVILTIPAAGSEGSSSCVIQGLHADKIIKSGISSNLIVPCFAILNPKLSFSLSTYQTACGVVDMMAHILERYFTNTKDVSVTDRICEGLLCSIIETVPRILNDPFDYGARANLMWAATLAHNNLCGVGREQDWASHHLEHQLSALYDCAHGAGLAVIMPAWMEYTMSHDVMRFAQFANRVFGIEMNFEDPYDTAKAGVSALREFFKSMSMPLNFEQLGANKDDIPKLLNMLGIDNHSEGHFMILDRSDCESIYNIAANYKE